MTLLAQPQLESVQKFSFSEGLSDRAVRFVARDSRGFIWIATDNGLNRYTGHAFEIYSNSSEPPFYIQENQIQKIEEIAGQKLVLLNKRDRPFIEIFDLESCQSQVVELDTTSGITQAVKAVHPERNGKVYVLTDAATGYVIYEMNGSFRFDIHAKIDIPNKSKVGNVRMIKSKLGHFWIMDDKHGLIKYIPTTKEFKHFGVAELHGLTSPSNTSYVTSILHEDAGGRLWLALPFRNGLLNVLPASGQLSKVPGFSEKELYSKLWEDQTGKLIVGTFLSFGKLNRLYMLGPDGSITDAQWILDIDNKINHLAGRDFSYIIVLSTITGTYRIKLHNPTVEWILADRQLEDGDWDNGISIRSITSDGADNLYIARELNYWYKFNIPNKKLEKIEVRDSNGNPIRLWCNSNVIYDPAGYIWGGSCADDRGGLLHRLDIATEITKTFPIPNKVIQHIVRTATGELLLASGAMDADGLLLFFDPKLEKLTEYYDADGTNPLTGKKPQFVAPGKDGLIWVGTDEGLVSIDRKKRRSKLYNVTNSRIPNDNVLVIHVDEQGKLLLGTRGGLIIFDVRNNTVKKFDTNNGLCNNTVCGILPDGQGNYFISTFYGLSFFDREQQLFSNFYKDKGFSFNEFNRLAFYQDENENYYFGTLNGINVFKKEDLMNLPGSKFSLQWTHLGKVADNGQKQEWSSHFSAFDKITMRHDDDYYWLEFSLPHYHKSEQNQYAVKLEGRDSAWQLLGNDPVYVLNRPPPGSYHLRIKAAPAQGTWLADELTLEVEVKEAFYQKAWFQIMMPVSVIFLSYVVSMWFIGRIREREEAQTQINKKFAELELQALQSQMNPHFVFNALGAIQYFIQKNNASAADSYLAKFAKLMRLFLESSKNKYISLAEEIKLLSLYVELEKMRFEDKFDFKITVDKELDIHSRELPSILIQPFVENAVNHGLFHKKENGLLNINFQKTTENGLRCTIEDNGVGRQKAGELKEKSKPTHKSRGMQLVNERLEVLQQVDEINILIKIEDLYPEEEETGTSVTIELPDLD